MLVRSVGSVVLLYAIRLTTRNPSDPHFGSKRHCFDGLTLKT